MSSLVCQLFRVNGSWPPLPIPATVTAVAYGLAYNPKFLGILKLILYMVFVDFVLIGLCVATACW
jgi:hypothetical protein